MQITSLSQINDILGYANFPNMTICCRAGSSNDVLISSYHQQH